MRKNEEKKSIIVATCLALVFSTMSGIAFAEGEGIKISQAFPDSYFRNYVEHEIDTDSNGYLSDEEIETVKYINISYYDVSDLTGIELLKHWSL